MGEIPLALWHSQLRGLRNTKPTVGRQRLWLEKNQRQRRREGGRSKAAESVVHSGSCSPCGEVPSGLHWALDSISQLPPRRGGGERWGLSVMSCCRGRGPGKLQLRLPGDVISSPRGQRAPLAGGDEGRVVAERPCAPPLSFTQARGVRHGSASGRRRGLRAPRPRLSGAIRG